MPVKGPGFGGGAAVGGAVTFVAAAGGAADGVGFVLRGWETVTAAKVPPAISTTIASRAGMTTWGRRHLRCLGVGVASGDGRPGAGWVADSVHRGGNAVLLA